MMGHMPGVRRKFCYVTAKDVDTRIENQKEANVGLARGRLRCVDKRSTGAFKRQWPRFALHRSISTLNKT